MRPTIYDVAQKAEVSMSTVSMVMNNKGSISDATRKKVMKVLEELQFTSSRSSIVLKKRSAYTVGLLIPNLENPLFVEITRNVCQRGHELGLSVVICNTENDAEK
ncbi:LacI family DNA-binding transcriptional regulator [Bacillus sp. OTU530]|uniref:LacI family DNA-binding transcriptional regulator n=1 Tax=Bacillus sp. OTU530 TaxID=3043862 RepID=UPI00313E843F